MVAHAHTLTSQFITLERMFFAFNENVSASSVSALSSYEILWRDQRIANAPIPFGLCTIMMALYGIYLHIANIFLVEPPCSPPPNQIVSLPPDMSPHRFMRVSLACMQPLRLISSRRYGALHISRDFKTNTQSEFVWKFVDFVSLFGC